MRHALVGILYACTMTIGFVTTSPATSTARSETRPASVNFLGKTFLLREESTTEFNYRPSDEKDHGRSDDTITLADTFQIRDAKAIAPYTGSLRNSYASSGLVMADECNPTECFLLSLHAKGNESVDIKISRVLFVDGRGLTAVFTHCEHGKDAMARARAWFGTKSGRDTIVGWRNWSPPKR